VCVCLCVRYTCLSMCAYLCVCLCVLALACAVCAALCVLHYASTHYQVKGNVRCRVRGSVLCAETEKARGRAVCVCRWVLV